MERTIIRAGNSLGVTLPPEMLGRFDLHQGSRVRLAVDEARGGILVVPIAVDVPGVDVDFTERVSRFIERYRPALESFAKR